ncbi:hypothetical protein [Acidobacterium sp. S8]|uniref:hypothetical protein n=1 Tax=Acidobacterium sp. S8 TaxID=1641854 RepID=UPI00131BAF03|nr:hypothetical protein [Acidobacterium sp. S8]
MLDDRAFRPSHQVEGRTLFSRRGPILDLLSAFGANGKATEAISCRFHLVKRLREMHADYCKQGVECDRMWKTRYLVAIYELKSAPRAAASDHAK